MRVFVVIATVTTHLLRCATDAVERTSDAFVIPLLGRSETHGEKLDRALRRLGERPDDDYMMTMDDDAAPLAPGWLSYLMIRCDEWAAFGDHMALGCLYRLGFLRAMRSKGLLFAMTRNPGDAFRIVSGYHVPPATAGPWWLHGTEYFRNDAGRLIFAHLGGGTIGATNWRIPARLWPVMVRRYLDRTQDDADIAAARARIAAREERARRRRAKRQ